MSVSTLEELAARSVAIEKPDRRSRRSEARARRRAESPRARHRAARVDLHRQNLAQPMQVGGLVVREKTVLPEELEWEVRKQLRLTRREEQALREGRATVIRVPGYGPRLVPKLDGGATGAGAIYAKNLPMPGTYAINPALFAAKTSRNLKTGDAIVHPGYGSSFTFRADAVGVLGRMFLIFEATITSGGTAATVTNHYPWNLARYARVSANGINQLFELEGLDLRALMRIRNGKHFFDRESSFAIPAATQSGTLRLIWEIPVAYDDSLLGAVFLQTEETQLSLNVQTALQADLFSANAPTFTNANWKVVTEFYSIPVADSQAGRVLVLPDLRQLHGIVQRNDPFSAATTVTSPLTRTGGILLRTLQRFDNAAPGNLDPGGTLLGGNITSHRFRYGGNVVPIDVPGFLRRLANEMDYGDSVLPAIDVVSGADPPDYLVDDYVVDSPLRDVIHMTGITEAQMLNTIAPTVTVNAGAQVHTVQEAMVAG